MKTAGRCVLSFFLSLPSPVGIIKLFKLLQMLAMVMCFGEGVCCTAGLLGHTEKKGNLGYGSKVEFLVKYQDRFSFGQAWTRGIQNLGGTDAHAWGKASDEGTTETLRFWNSETCKREEKRSMQVSPLCLEWGGQNRSPKVYESLLQPILVSFCPFLALI